MRLAQQGARSAFTSGRRLVSYDDLVSEAYVWMVTHMDKVVQWREEGLHGKNKLRRACRQHGLTVIAGERRKRAGISPSDQFYYSPAMLRELLPAIWDPDDWTTSTIVSEERKAPSRPSEGNNRLAMICDIRGGFYNLPTQDQVLLFDVYGSGGALTWQQIADREGVSEKTIRRREERAIERLLERLGGGYPFV